MAEPTEHANASLLRALYGELTRIGEYVTDDVVYHLAGRDVGLGVPRLDGKEAVVANEQALAEATEGTLTAHIDSITANAYFGTVTGVFRARPTVLGGAEFTMPFCGVWRFGPDGLITTHWQNAYDPAAMFALLAGQAAPAR